jgi:hypothetical protein
LLKNNLGGQCSVVLLPIPLRCKDGFQEGSYGRSESLLNKEVRLSQSVWGYLSEDKQTKLLYNLLMI